MQEESLLIERVKKGEDEAMEAVVKKYKRKVYYLAYDLTNNSEDAEDLTQEVFFKAFSRIDSFKGESAFGTWLYRITFNHYLDKRKKKSFLMHKNTEEIHDSSDEMFQISEHNPARKYEDKQIYEHVNFALKKISPREKCVFILRHYNDHQIKEISEIMDISEGTVKSLLFRAVKKLQKELAYYIDCYPAKERS
jgi:RNA polymerase sigma-70 factor (ECF subfamily)